MTRTLPSEECRYQPNGDMCLVCKRVLKNCSQLPFNQYPVIGKYKDGQQIALIVKCREYEKVEDEQIKTLSVLCFRRL